MRSVFRRRKNDKEPVGSPTEAQEPSLTESTLSTDNKVVAPKPVVKCVEVVKKVEPVKEVPPPPARRCRTQKSIIPDCIMHPEPGPVKELLANLCGSTLIHLILSLFPYLSYHYVFDGKFLEHWPVPYKFAILIFIANIIVSQTLGKFCVAEAGFAYMRCKGDTEEKKNYWWRAGISGILGAIIAGLLLKCICASHIFFEPKLLPINVLESVNQGTSGFSYNILDAVFGSTVTEYLDYIISLGMYAVMPFVEMFSWLLFLICPQELIVLLNALGDGKRIIFFCSFFDLFVVEFVCAFFVYSIVAMLSVLEKVIRVSFATQVIAFTAVSACVALCVPLCGTTGGPMLGLSFVGMIAANQLDLWKFLLFACADACAIWIVTRIYIGKETMKN